MTPVDRALLLAALPTLDTPHFLAAPIATAATAAQHRLLVVLVSSRFTTPSHWPDVHRLLTYVYVQATRVAQARNRVLMAVDVLLHPQHQPLPAHLALAIDAIFRVPGGHPDPITALPPELSALPQVSLPPGHQEPTHPPAVDSPSSQYPVVALGGTFDHLHAGHKILLSMGAWIASKKLIVGITDDSLLQRKSNKHVLETLTQRMHRVRAFLNLFKPGIVHDLVPITDVYGPTGWDHDIQALVVSKETLGGADAIATHRASHSLPPLRTFVIDVISSSATLDHDDLEMLRETKMSSTFIREWIVNNSKQEEEEGSDDAN